MNRVKWAIIFYVVALVCLGVMTWKYGLRAALLGYITSMFMGGCMGLLRDDEKEGEEDDEDNLHAE